MIRYALRCADGHDFESWFPSSASYDAQRARGLVACPACGSIAVEKAVMAPAVARNDRSTPRAAEAPAAAPGADAPPAVPTLAPAPHQEALRAVLREFRAHVVRTADYVGDDFARLARDMHEGGTEHRAIYGEASSDEVQALRDDEIEIMPLPALPDDCN